MGEGSGVSVSNIGVRVGGIGVLVFVGKGISVGVWLAVVVAVYVGDAVGVSDGTVVGKDVAVFVGTGVAVGTDVAVGAGVVGNGGNVAVAERSSISATESDVETAVPQVVKNMTKPIQSTICLYHIFFSIHTNLLQSQLHLGITAVITLTSRNL